ncbi:Aspartate/tyrosine/aromatic aminotransferase [Pseudomonas savastanoi]|uniref:Aspartate/tyrosine/aromatic aminotransferase n=4 Tax=Pseudomonas syringae group TaxID=136849 RepID=A0A0P9PT42_PSEA0|nr:Aspartate/tyrosine/aromatic aminotransferase [Pseudomonas amygdali pv. ciccaronei]KPW90603.1 Aspartate/tyrosine/aromatic aminotransferase [Pseudomonas syringae pv. castaneae]KPX21480.1 Aspartate/tyrosine/aromatic aminotransferase [Pseudomonas amygdali pv. eriobotryae]KPY04120.1 Aspartate/tyrosine/aromatic aminotransferase [Pseudomonas savastanoi pv. nerii]KPY39882.1 Aspartate/tyrosine/aromatic aminotransferase [Pseudomonas syringae pv. rhaphiolepidis]KPY50718.1 Aspartate/tyrosine/aromatic a
MKYNLLLFALRYSVISAKNKEICFGALDIQDGCTPNNNDSIGIMV